MSKLSHLDEKGQASMVDVSEKPATAREATAEATIVLSEETFAMVFEGKIKKGDVLATARIAGIMAAKRTSELIPLCHPLPLSHIGVEFAPLPDGRSLRVVASAKTTGQTGVEMEALTAAAIAALTVYDMVKAVDKGAVIQSVRLLAKSGGNSGSYIAPEQPEPRSGPPAKAQRGSRASPRVLIHETAAPRASPSSEREAFRSFMLERRLRATEWASSAGVPLNELYGYLSGHSRTLSAKAAGKLAKAARSSIDEMFGRKSPQ